MKSRILNPHFIKSFIFCLLFICLVSGTLFLLRLNTPSIIEIEYAVSDARFARDIHQWYVDNDYYREYTGDIEWHQEWVKSYNHTISILESYKRLVDIIR